MDTTNNESKKPDCLRCRNRLKDKQFYPYGCKMSDITDVKVDIKNKLGKNELLDYAWGRKDKCPHFVLKSDFKV